MSAFIKFEELGLDDYIIKTGKKILCKTMPLETYTADDIILNNVVFQAQYEDKEFKKIILHASEEESVAPDSVSDFRAETSQTKVQKNVQQIIEQNIENITENVTNNVLNEIHNVQQENIDHETLILNQLEQSNSYTEQNIIELEQHLQNFNQNTYVTKHTLNNLETKILNNQEVHYNELKEEIKEHKNYFHKFINS